jgi:hypothetical protein
MSYEYFVTINQRDIRPLAEFIQPILPWLPVEVLSISNEEVRLRWKNLPRRPDWPEDVIVMKNTRGIYISFHVGSEELRQLMLDSLNKLLNDEVGPAIKFVEL